MTLRWNDAWHQRMTNTVLANYAIPAEIKAPAPEDDPDDWKYRVNGGTLETVLELIHSKQDAIVSRFDRLGMASVTRQDALFMYSSQWFEWNAAGGCLDPEHEEMLELMENWLTMYLALGNGFLN